MNRLTSLLAEYFLQRQPPAIQGRLQENAEFERSLDLRTEQVIILGGEASVRQGALFKAARRVFAEGAQVQIPSLQGSFVMMGREAESIYLSLGPGRPTLTFDELMLLSDDSALRLKFLANAVAKIGPLGPDFAHLERAARERPLEDSELGLLLEELFNGVQKLQSDLRAKLQAGNAQFADLVPSSLDYFDRYCGPNPIDEAPEEYLHSTLQTYRRSILERDLRKGLEIALLGGLGDDVRVTSLVEDVSDDKLWEALVACESTLDPFSLINALDLALTRQHDLRFRDFADAAVARLAAPEFRWSDGADVYQLLSVVFRFVLCTLNIEESAMLRPSFWRRMCAWMQTILVVRLMHDLGIDVQRAAEAFEAHLPAEGLYANLMDLRTDPMVKAIDMTPFMIRAVVQERLQRLAERQESGGKTMPRADEIEASRARLDEQELFAWAFPGPLGGHRRPQMQAPAHFTESLSAAQPEVLVAKMAKLAQIFHLDEGSIDLVREALQASKEGASARPFRDVVPQLVNASTIAAAARQGQLAEAIAEVVHILAPTLQPEEVPSALQILLVAGAAFDDDRSWARWISDQFTILALNLPPGKSCAMLWKQLQLLKAVTRKELQVYRQPEAISSAGAS